MGIPAKICVLTATQMTENTDTLWLVFLGMNSVYSNSGISRDELRYNELFISDCLKLGMLLITHGYHCLPMYNFTLTTSNLGN